MSGFLAYIFITASSMPASNSRFDVSSDQSFLLKMGPLLDFAPRQLPHGRPA